MWIYSNKKWFFTLLFFILQKSHVFPEFSDLPAKNSRNVSDDLNRLQQNGAQRSESEHMHRHSVINEAINISNAEKLLSWFMNPLCIFTSSKLMFSFRVFVRICHASLSKSILAFGKIKNTLFISHISSEVFAWNRSKMFRNIHKVKFRNSKQTLSLKKRVGSSRIVDVISVENMAELAKERSESEVASLVLLRHDTLMQNASVHL